MSFHWIPFDRRNNRGIKLQGLFSKSPWRPAKPLERIQNGQPSKDLSFTLDAFVSLFLLCVSLHMGVFAGVTGREMGEVIVIHSCSSNLLIYSISFSELAICPASFLGQHSLPTPIYFQPACQWPSHKCHKHVCDCHHTAADDTFYLICALELSRARDHSKRHMSMHIFQCGV